MIILLIYIYIYIHMCVCVCDTLYYEVSKIAPPWG